MFKEIKMKLLLLGLVALVAGCSSTQNATTMEKAFAYSDTMEIIRSAAESAPNGVEGDYILKIKGAGNQGKFVYLNSELDYRDPRAVTVALHPTVVPAFIEQYGANPQDYFVNKSISVSGKAQRIRINFSIQNKPSSKYYYQTHIRVTDISQIKILSQDA